MFLKLLGILLTVIAVFATAIFIGIGLLLILEFWWLGAIFAIFMVIMYILASVSGLDIQFYPRY